MSLKRLVVLLLLFFCQTVYPLGRLFITPEQRIQLMQNKKPVQVSVSETTDAFDPQSIYLNGFVKAKHGTSTIWVNGQTRKVKPERTYHVRHWVSKNNKISVDLNATETRVVLSPGQVLDVDNLTVKEVYALDMPENQLQREQEPESIAKKTQPSVLQKAIKLNQTITSYPE